MKNQKHFISLGALVLVCLFASCSKQRFAQQTDYLPTESIANNYTAPTTTVVYAEVEPTDFTNSFDFQLVESEFAVPVILSEEMVEEITVDEIVENTAPVVKLSKKEKKAAAVSLNQKNKIGLVLMGAGVILAVAGLGTVGGVTAISGLVVFLLGVF